MPRHLRAAGGALPEAEAEEGLTHDHVSFKQRLWGNMGMISSVLGMSGECLLEHLSLDQETGLDPAGEGGEIKVRPAEGLEGVEWLMPGFWVWAKVVRSLADIGYDSSNLAAMPYDFRLEPALLEQRDAVLSRLKAMLEISLQQHGKRAAVLAHSYGDTLFRYFMNWVEAADPGWTEKHVTSYVNIAGPQLGVPKALPTMLTGDTRETAELSFMMQLGEYAPHAVLNPGARVRLLRTWTSVSHMLPKGGEAVWGRDGDAPDAGGAGGHGVLVCVNPDKDDECEERWTVDEALERLWKAAPAAYTFLVRSSVDFSTTASASPGPLRFGR